MKLSDFFQRHPVFAVEELAACLRQRGTESRWTRKTLVSHHEKQGHILRVRRGLYAVVPPGTTPDTCPVDPYLVASKLAADAVLAYHTALAFHGKAHSASEHFQYLTGRQRQTMTFRSYRFQAVQFSKALRRKREETCGVKVTERAGLDVRVTSLERTLVDVLDRPDLGGGWEEIWRSLESVEFFDLDQVVRYALLLDNATTAAKVGFFLEQHREALMVEEVHLRSLRRRRPKQPHYLARGSRASGKLVADWNLIVPHEVLQQSWREPQ